MNTRYVHCNSCGKNCMAMRDGAPNDLCGACRTKINKRQASKKAWVPKKNATIPVVNNRKAAINDADVVRTANIISANEKIAETLEKSGISKSDEKIKKLYLNTSKLLEKLTAPLDDDESTSEVTCTPTDANSPIVTGVIEDAVNAKADLVTVSV